jgi:hypothetical protein
MFKFLLKKVASYGTIVLYTIELQETPVLG